MPLISTARAAEIAGLTPAAFRKAASRERARVGGVDLQARRDRWPDARTPMYDERKVRAWVAGRASPESA
jgi:hypothetical protein